MSKVLKRMREAFICLSAGSLLKKQKCPEVVACLACSREKEEATGRGRESKGRADGREVLEGNGWMMIK